MDKDQIKTELISEVEILLSLNKKKLANTAAGIGKIKAMADHAGKMDDFSNRIIDILNEILQKNKIELNNEDDKNELLAFLKPTVADLLRKYIRS